MTTKDEKDNSPIGTTFIYRTSELSKMNKAIRALPAVIVGVLGPLGRGLAVEGYSHDAGFGVGPLLFPPLPFRTHPLHPL
jgi:hypothetical protein